MKKFQKHKRKFYTVSICCLLAMCLAVPFAWNSDFGNMVGTVLSKNKSNGTQHKAFDSAKSAIDALNGGQNKSGKVTSVNGFSNNSSSNGLDYSSSNNDNEIVKYLKSDDYKYNSKVYDDVDLVAGDDSFSKWPTAIVDGTFSSKNPEVLSMTGQDSHFTVDLDNDANSFYPGQIISLGKTAPKDGTDIKPYNPENPRVSPKITVSLLGPSTLENATQEVEADFEHMSNFKTTLMNEWHKQEGSDTSSIGYDFSISSATTNSEVSAKFGLDAGKNAKIKASDEYKNDTQSLVIIYKFNDFSINIANDTPLSTLVGGYDANDFKNNFKSSNPAGFIDSITYGREVIVTLTTNKLSNTFAADVQSEAAGIKTEGKWQEQRANMSAQVSVIGESQGEQDGLVAAINAFIADPSKPINQLGSTISQHVKQLDNKVNFMSCNPLSCTIRHLCAYDEDTQSYNSPIVANGAYCISNPLALNNATHENNAKFINTITWLWSDGAKIEYDYIKDFNENGEAIIDRASIHKDEFDDNNETTFTFPSTAFNIYVYYRIQGTLTTWDANLYEEKDAEWKDPIDPNKTIKGKHTNASYAHSGGVPSNYGPINGNTWKDADGHKVCNYLTYPTVSDTGVVWYKYVKPDLLTYAEFKYDGHAANWDADFDFKTNGGPESCGGSWHLHYD